MVGKGPIELEIHAIDRQRQGRKASVLTQNRRHGVTGHSVPRVHDDREGTNIREVDEFTKVAGVIGERVSRLSFTHRLVGFWDAGANHLLDVGKPRVLAHWCGAHATQFDAVVLGRIVARREHGSW